MCFRGFLLLEALILKHSHPIISWKTRTGSCIWCGDLPKIWWWPEYHSDRWLQDVFTRNDFIKACVNDVYTYNRYYQVLSSYSCGKPLFSFVFLWPLGKPKHQRWMSRVFQTQLQIGIEVWVDVESEGVSSSWENSPGCYVSCTAKPGMLIEPQGRN